MNKLMSLHPIINTMRPTQWTKNLVLFAALVFDRQLLNIPALVTTIAGFILFCIISSLVYLINDIIDVQADRQHPQKQHRPIAAGQLSVMSALLFGIGLFCIAFPLAYYLSAAFALVGLLYFLSNLAYSRWLKHIPIIDVMFLAAAFIMRVLAGMTLIQVERFSPWLFVITSLLALFLGFGKRRAELALLAEDASIHRRVLDGYTLPFLDQLITMISSTTVIAYSLYTFSAPNLPANHSMMLTIPFVLYGILRYLYLIQMEQCGGAPEIVLLKDRPMQITIILWIATVIIVFYSGW